MKSYPTLLNSCLPQISLKCRAPEVSQCVFQNYEMVLKNWKPPTDPAAALTDSWHLLLLSLTWPTDHITASYSAGATPCCVGTLYVNPAVKLGWLMIFVPFLTRRWLFFFPKTEENPGWLSWLALSCPLSCMFCYTKVSGHYLITHFLIEHFHIELVLHFGMTCILLGTDGCFPVSAWGPLIII